MKKNENTKLMSWEKVNAVSMIYFANEVSSCFFPLSVDISCFYFSPAFLFSEAFSPVLSKNDSERKFTPKFVDDISKFALM